MRFAVLFVLLAGFNSGCGRNSAPESPHPNLTFSPNAPQDNRVDAKSKAAAKEYRAGSHKSYVEYQGERFQLARAYRDFGEYKDDPNNLPVAEVARIESTMRRAKFGPKFANAKALGAALFSLQFPGYGSFYANQLGAGLDSTLELVYVEIPRRGLNRYIVLEKQSNGVLLVVDDFVAPSQPEITRVRRTNATLRYRSSDGQVLIPDRQ